MAQQTVDVGSFAGDGTGDPLREAFTKINENFTELYLGTAYPGALTYANLSSNVAGITFTVTRYADSYSASPVLSGTGQNIGNVYKILGNTLGGTTPFNDLTLTVTSLANVVLGSINTVSAAGIPESPVLRVNNQTGNVILTVNNITDAASKGYVNAAISANVANVTGAVTDSLRANITAANAVISNHTSRITTLESNAATQATAINNLTNTKATITYVDASIDLALSSNAVLANVASVNANVAAANAAILLRANLSGANFTGNITANNITSVTHTYTNYLDVGHEPVPEWFTNRGASFLGNQEGFYGVYVQNQNANATTDLMAWTNGDISYENYVVIGIAGTNFSDARYPKQLPRDAYVYAVGGNLYLESETHAVQMITANVVRMEVQQSGTVRILSNLTFADGTIQNTAFGGNLAVSSINANIAAANVAISLLQSNAVIQSIDIDNLYSNAGTQSTLIQNLQGNAATQAVGINGLNGSVNTLISNAATQATLITTLTANAAIQALSIASLTANSAAQQLDIDNLYGNVGLRASEISSLNANLVAANLTIVSLESNAATQATILNTLVSNAATQAVTINSLVSNAAAQAVILNTLQSNAASQETTILSLYSNAAAQAVSVAELSSNISSLLSNAATQAAAINTLTANAATQAVSVDTLIANAATQATAINTLTANAATQAAAIDTLNANSATQASAIDTLNANSATQAVSIDTLTANAATQTVLINSINANIVAVNLALGNVGSNLESISSNLIPSANITYSLGSQLKQWKDLWVSSNTIYIGGTAVTVQNGNLLVGGSQVGAAVPAFDFGTFNTPVNYTLDLGTF